MQNQFKLALLLTKKIHSSIEQRIDIREFRVFSLKELLSPIIKIAFDTRRINQDTECNPRRNLQHYHRSEPFISKDVSEKIKTFFKLKSATDSIKEDFLGDPEWHDSYCRVLSAAVDRTLRIDQKDMDFSSQQIDYLGELLYLRYRIKEGDILRLSEKDLKDIIINKDEKLLHKYIYSNYNSKNNVIKHSDMKIIDAPIINNQKTSNNDLVGQLFGEVRATSDKRNVKRSVKIEIEDSIVDEKK